MTTPHSSGCVASLNENARPTNASTSRCHQRCSSPVLPSMPLAVTSIIVQCDLLFLSLPEYLTPVPTMNPTFHRIQSSLQQVALQHSKQVVLHGHAEEHAAAEPNSYPDSSTSIAICFPCRRGHLAPVASPRWLQGISCPPASVEIGPPLPVKLVSWNCHPLWALPVVSIPCDTQDFC